MIFAEKLKMLRKQAGRSQEKLAEKLGVSCSSRTESSTIIKADLRERMLPHGKENFEKK